MSENNHNLMELTGLSGTMILLPVRMLINISVVVVRKPKAQIANHGELIESIIPYIEISCKKYVIIDDFTETGETISRIIRTVPESWECVGIILYRGREYHTYDKDLSIPIAQLRSEYDEMIELLSESGGR